MSLNYRGAVALNYRGRSHEQGLARAQFLLGLMYHLGQGVPDDQKQAIGWFLKAAEQGYGEAQDALGTMYFLAQTQYQMLGLGHLRENGRGAKKFRTF